MPVLIPNIPGEPCPSDIWNSAYLGYNNNTATAQNSLEVTVTEGNLHQDKPSFIPQDDEDQENAVDYSSLSGLMSALATHGPNTIPVNENEEVEDTGTQEEEDRRDNIPVFAEEVRL